MTTRTQWLSGYESPAVLAAVRRGGDAVVRCYTVGRFPPRPGSGTTSDDEAKDAQGLYEVRIIDNDHNTYREVMDVAMEALGVTEEMAFAIAWEVDHAGSCVVAHAPKSEADALAEVIRTIGIEVRVNPLDPTQSVH